MIRDDARGGPGRLGRYGRAVMVWMAGSAADGTDRGLTVGGSPAEVAAYLDGYRQIGVGEIIFVFRDPFDLETIERLGEVGRRSRLHVDAG